MRSVVFRFDDITAFSVALGDAQGSLALPEGETVVDGEWVLATFEIGSRRRATAAAARGVCAAGDTHLTFERRDWDRLLSFVAARSEHMRAARPATSSNRVPVAPPSSPTFSETEPPSSTLESSRVPFGSRVLLVDDDATARDEIRRILTEVGLRVDAVASVGEATAKMASGSFDALVVDFHSTDIDPLDFVRAVRRDFEQNRLPVLFLSHRPTSRDAVDAFASGADDFLPKPFRAPELGARIFGLLRRARLAAMSSIAPASMRGPGSSGAGGDGP